MVRTLTTLMSLLPALVLAQSLGGELVGKSAVVNNGPGDQTDPHVSGPLVAYTSEAGGASQIRYHHLETGRDLPIPSSGSYDFVSDISGATVVFTRVTSTSAIFTYDVDTEASPREIAPQPGANRRGAVIGFRTVAWQDFSYRGTTLEPEIATYDLDSGVLTRLTQDTLLDRTPAVSADGKVIVWAKCQTDGTRCDIWQATQGPGGFLLQQLTGAEGDELQPDTNGQMVVYASTRTEEGVAERDIYWQPVGGGAEQRLALTGVDTNPSVSGSLVAFERYDTSAAQPNFDIYLYDLRTATLYPLTQTPERNENLNDISVSEDGTVNVVWTVAEGGDFNVHAFSFRLPGAPKECASTKQAPPAEEVCAAPGSRVLLASMEVGRSTGAPTEASVQFQGSGQGVLCVDNGYQGERSTSGQVTLNGARVVGPSLFQQKVALVAQSVELRQDNALTARVAGAPGASFRVRVYGPQQGVCAEAGALAPGEQAVPGVSIAPVQAPRSAASEVRAPEAFILGGQEVLSDSAQGCSAGGGSLAAAGALALAALLLRGGRRQRRPVE